MRPSAFLYPLFWLIASTPAFAFDSANDSTVDKADRFDFEEFHKDSGDGIQIGTLGQKKKDDSKAITTYEEADKTTTKTPHIVEQVVTPEATTTPVKPAGGQSYGKDQVLKVRSAYTFSSDPTLGNLPTLFEAVQDIHRQLNNYCPAGWGKTDEWHKPQDKHYFVYYEATCL